MRVGIMHPGEMGVTVGAAAAFNGHEVLWASQDRSDATRKRAEAAGFTDTGSLAKLTRDADVIVSVCPPHAALDMAYQVSALGFCGLYCDCNAIAPATAREIARTVDIAGAMFADGGIVGPPARTAGTTRLSVSGEGAAKVSEVFRGSVLETLDAGERPGAASALKASYAAWSKGSAALLLAIRALARAEGVEDALLAEWARSQQGLEQRSDRAARGNARKAWRFAGEMEQIAAAFQGAGLPDGFHLGAADLYRRLEGFKDTEGPPSIDEVLARLLDA